MARPTLEEIYGKKSRPSLEEIYSNKQKTYVNPMGQTQVSDVGSLDVERPVEQEPTGSKAYKFVAGAITDPAITLAGGLKNFATGSQDTSMVNPLTGEQVQSLGYDEQGNALSTGQTVTQGLGAAAQVVPITKGLSLLGKGAKVAKLGVNPLGSTMRKSVGTVAGLGAMYSGAEAARNIEAQDGFVDTGLNIAGQAALGGVTSAALGVGSVLAGRGINKVLGKESLDDILNRAQQLEREGKVAEATTLRQSPQVQAELTMAGVKDIDKTIAKDIANFRRGINDGIGRSAESAALKRTLAAEKITDDDILGVMTNARAPGPGDESRWAPTMTNINNIITDLYESGATPLLTKIRKTGIQLGENIDTNNIVNLVEKTLDKSDMLAANKSELVNAFRNIIKQEEAAALAEGRVFDIGDMFRLKTSANAAFEKISPKGELGRATGKVLRDMLDKQAKVVKNKEAREVIAHLREIDNAASNLYRQKNLVTFMSKLPAQKASIWMDRILGAASIPVGGPLAYPVVSMMSNNVQKAIMAKRTSRLLGGIASKTKSSDPDRIIGGSKLIMDKLDNLVAERNTTRNMAKTLASVSKNYTKATADEAKRLADRFKGNPVPIDNKYTPEDKLPVIEMGESTSKYNKKSNLPTIRGMITPNQINTMTAATGLAGLAALAQKKFGTETYTREPEVAPEIKVDDIKELASQIATAETRGETEPYSTSKWSNRKLGPASPLGKDLGKYQITSARLSEKSKEFLGRKVSDSEFLKSPELQDKFIEAQIRWQLSHGMTPDEVLATHRRGWGNMKKEQLDKAVATTSEYRNQARGLKD